MYSTVFLTVLSGVTTYIIGQLVLKLVIEPVQETKRTIARISHSLVEHADVIHNPGVPKKEKTEEVSQHLRNLSSQLRAHLFLVPGYRITAFILRLPSQNKILAASKALMGLSNSIFSATNENIYEQNAKRCEKICDSLRIYFAAEERWPTE